MRQRALTALLLGVLSLIGLMLGLGNLRRGIFVAVLALLFAATRGLARRDREQEGAARRHGPAALGGRRGGARRSASSFSALWLLVLAMFWPQLNAYYTCMSGANTVTAQQACHKQFTNSVGARSALQSGRLRPGAARFP